MPRQARLDSPGTLHHVMVRGIEKGRIVNDDHDRENFVSRLGQLSAETRTAIYAWALMNNHAHILLRSSPMGLSALMRRFLTGYAISYNRRHRRWGHLFQNRYKSIVCDEDVYFKALVRYIHLNPIRAGAVASITKLERYRWCGHSVVMGTIESDWQDRGYVLKWFGRDPKEATPAYRLFVQQGIKDGRRPELVGGGLIRSSGGWSAVKAMRCSAERELSDERILGDGQFVERVIKEAEPHIRYQLPATQCMQVLDEYVDRLCHHAGISVEELASGTRRREVSALRADITIGLVKAHGASLAEVARRVGVSTSAISKLLKRRNSKSY